MQKTGRKNLKALTQKRDNWKEIVEEAKVHCELYNQRGAFASQKKRVIASTLLIFRSNNFTIHQIAERRSYRSNYSSRFRSRGRHCKIFFQTLLVKIVVAIMGVDHSCVLLTSTSTPETSTLRTTTTVVIETLQRKKRLRG